jgi:hypothetical protein
MSGEHAARNTARSAVSHESFDRGVIGGGM